MSKLILMFFMIPTLLGFNMSYGFGIVRKNNHERPDIGSKYNNIINNHNACYIGKDEKLMYLTFDMGYENGYTNTILDTLKDNNVKASFFVTGHYMETNKDLILRMYNEGHIVGNHTYHHIDITKANKEKIEEELDLINNKYKEITNSDMKKYVRPPEGRFNDQSLTILDDLGYKTIFWSLAYKDWDRNKQNGIDYMLTNTTNYFHNGAIILLHAVSKDNNDGLDKMIKEAINMGYSFDSLDNL